MKNILVFPCGSEIGLEIHRSVCRSIHFQLFGASSVPDHGRFVYARYLTIDSMVDDPGFEDEINRLIVDNAIDFVLPAHDSAVLKFAEMQDYGRLKATAIVPGHEVAAICRSKKATYQLLADVVKTPGIYKQEDLCYASYPIFAKPDVGQGSKGAELVPDFRAALEKLRREPTTLFMDYLPGNEYTVDCFTDSKGKLRFQSARSRGRIANGISVSNRKGEHPSLIGMGQAINKRLRMRGAWFFQAREDFMGEAALLEIAPRIAGSSGFQRAKGVNLTLLSLYDRLGSDVWIMPNQFDTLEVDRALTETFFLDYDYEAVYIDFDDTLCRFDSGVNVDVVKFIFQCHNQNIRVVLLTRHVGDLELLLEKYRLKNLFSEVVRIANAQSKADFIKEKKALFIDDSFAERRDVQERLGIPVFDPAAIEVLINHKL